MLRIMEYWVTGRRGGSRGCGTPIYVMIFAKDLTVGIKPSVALHDSSPCIRIHLRDRNKRAGVMAAGIDSQSAGRRGY